MLIYIHVPFCKKKCEYCAFYSESISENNAENSTMSFTEQEGAWHEAGESSWLMKKQIWLDTLMLEMEKASRKYEKPAVKTIFFGGGTPSLLEAETIDLILKKIKKLFKVDKKAEITLESNPESLNSILKVRNFLSTGINRISLGVQSLDNNLLKKLGRVHDLTDSLNALSYLKSGGCKNINVDMMWGLPEQRASQWISQGNDLMKLKPDHISAYSLTIEQDTPFEKMLEEGKIVLPEENEASMMYMRASEIFEEHGYLQYEISNYSRMGFQCRHNIGYWEGVDYLGFGPSATSTVKNIRWTNPFDLHEWKKAVENSHENIEKEVLSLQDRVIELIMLRLRTTRGLRVKAFNTITGRDFMKDNKKLIQALHENGLIRIMNGYVRLTRHGFMVSNSILSHLFENTKKHLALDANKMLNNDDRTKNS